MEALVDKLMSNLQMKMILYHSKMEKKITFIVYRCMSSWGFCNK